MPKCVNKDSVIRSMCCLFIHFSGNGCFIEATVGGPTNAVPPAYISGTARHAHIIIGYQCRQSLVYDSVIMDIQNCVMALYTVLLVCLLATGT